MIAGDLEDKNLQYYTLNLKLTWTPIYNIVLHLGTITKNEMILHKLYHREHSFDVQDEFPQVRIKHIWVLGLKLFISSLAFFVILLKLKVSWWKKFYNQSNRAENNLPIKISSVKFATWISTIILQFLIHIFNALCWKNISFFSDT